MVVTEGGAGGGVGPIQTFPFHCATSFATRPAGSSMGNAGDTGDDGQDTLAHVGPPETLLRTIINLTDDAVLTCDVEATLSSVSENAERLFGRQPQDLLSRPITILFPPHLNDEVRGVFSRVVAGERIRHFETEIVRPDGLPIPVSLSLAP